MRWSGNCKPVDFPDIPQTACRMQELSYVDKVSEFQYDIKEGYVPNMRVPGRFYVNSALAPLILDEIKQHCNRNNVSSFRSSPHAYDGCQGTPLSPSIMICKSRICFG